MDVAVELDSVAGVNAPAPTTFEEFWPYYVSQHLHPATRALHAWGPLFAVALGTAGVALGLLWAPLLALGVGYGIAWFSHFVIERNKPASWGRPAWSFRGDMLLIRRYFDGSLESEVAAVRRACGLRAEQRTLADAGVPSHA